MSRNDIFDAFEEAVVEKRRLISENEALRKNIEIVYSRRDKIPKHPPLKEVVRELDFLGYGVLSSRENNMVCAVLNFIDRKFRE